MKELADYHCLLVAPRIQANFTFPKSLNTIKLYFTELIKRKAILKTVLCYGDSNTHGYIAGTGERYPFNIRWTGVLQEVLGGEIRVIEEGLNGRTTVYDDPLRADRNGATFLPLVLESHAPIDILVLMLGTNDVLQNQTATVIDAAHGVSTLIDLTRETCIRLGLTMPQIILVSPPLLTRQLKVGEQCGSRNSPKTDSFSTQYQAIAHKQKCIFVDASKIVSASKIDGIHLESDDHQKLGCEIARIVKEII